MATTIQTFRRQSLMEATWAVVARVGVDNATVRAIAKEAGCTTGSLWHHFRGRDDLIVQALDQLAKTFFEEAEQKWLLQEPGLARLRALVVSLAPKDLKQRDRALTLFRLWSGAGAHTPTARALRKHYRRLHKLMVSFVGEAIGRGELAADLDAPVVAEALIALGDGLCVARTLSFSKNDGDRDAPIDAVLNGLARAR